MSKIVGTKPVLFIEKMHGFDQVVAKFILPETKIIYADLPTIVEESAWQNRVLGIVKGPRTILGKQALEQVVCRHPGLAVSYIGRHPQNVLAQDVQCAPVLQEETVTFASTRYGRVPLFSFASSPLSSAVCAYTVTLSEDLLQGRFERAEQLSIHAGNTFARRIGHTFTEDVFWNRRERPHYHIAVIGSGDIGSRVICSYARRGAHVRYTATQEKSSFSGWASFVPSLAQLFQGSSRMDLLTIHLPSGVLVPLEQIQDIGVFLNTSSGSNVDEEELIRALEERRIHTALIDVFRQEGTFFHGSLDPSSNRLIQSKLNPYPHHLDMPSDTKRKRLLQRFLEEKRLFLTPHIGYLEKSAASKALASAIERILRYQNIPALA